MSEHKVDIETAEADLERFCVSQGLETDIENMSEEVDPKTKKSPRDNYVKNRAEIVALIQKGAVVIDADDLLVYKPQRESNLAQIKFKEPEGSMWFAFDKGGENENIKKMVNAVAEITGCSPQVISKLKNIDFKAVVMTIYPFVSA